MTPSELQGILQDTCFEDVFYSGFVDPGETPARFHIMPGVFHVQCGAVLIEFRAIGTSGRMLVSKVTVIRPNAEIDEDMTAAVTSMRFHVLRDPDGTNQLSAISLWDLVSVAEGLTCSAAQLTLANGQEIFIDPTYHFGLRVGGTEQKAVWHDTWPAAAEMKETILALVERPGSVDYV